MPSKDSCSVCGKRVGRSKTSRAEIVCHDCRRQRGRLSSTSAGYVPPSKRTTCSRCGDYCYRDGRTEQAPELSLCQPCKTASKPTAVCPQCGSVFAITRDRKTFCSRDCNYAAKSKAVATEFACIVPWTPCWACGLMFVARQRNHRYCSQRCAQRKVMHQVWFITCIDCGVLHCARARNTRRCKPCRALHVWRERKRRNAQRKNAGVSKLLPYIGARDKWMCGICGKAVRRRDYDHSDPMSPTVDHIIPVSEEPIHEPWNLRLAHMICNSRRQHYGGGEQLMLVG